MALKLAAFRHPLRSAFSCSNIAAASSARLFATKSRKVWAGIDDILQYGESGQAATLSDALEALHGLRRPLAKDARPNVMESPGIIKLIENIAQQCERGGMETHIEAVVGLAAAIRYLRLPSASSNRAQAIDAPPGMRRIGKSLLGKMRSHPLSDSDLGNVLTSLLRLGVRDDGYMKDLISDRVAAGLGTATPKDCVQLLSCLHRVDVCSGNEIDALVRRLAEVAQSMSPTDVAPILGVFTKLKVRDRLVIERCKEILAGGGVNQRDLSSAKARLAQLSL